jgi:hypothetical protein
MHIHYRRRIAIAVECQNDVPSLTDGQLAFDYSKIASDGDLAIGVAVDAGTLVRYFLTINLVDCCLHAAH